MQIITRGDFLKTCLKNLKKFKVCNSGEQEPCGVIRDACILFEKDRIAAFLIESISLIPTNKIITIDDIDFAKDKTIFLKKGHLSKNINLYENLHKLNDIENVETTKRKRNLLKDLHFNFETGEITDIVISKNKLSKNTKIPINKIYIKDNTIYIE